jgi:hypothetical protein
MTFFPFLPYVAGATIGFNIKAEALSSCHCAVNIIVPLSIAA